MSWCQHRSCTAQHGTQHGKLQHSMPPSTAQHDSQARGKKKATLIYLPDTYKLLHSMPTSGSSLLQAPCKETSIRVFLRTHHMAPSKAWLVM
jgi:hypothetical protein